MVQSRSSISYHASEPCSPAHSPKWLKPAFSSAYKRHPAGANGDRRLSIAPHRSQGGVGQCARANGQSGAFVGLVNSLMSATDGASARTCAMYSDSIFCATPRRRMAWVVTTEWIHSVVPAGSCFDMVSSSSSWQRMRKQMAELTQCARSNGTTAVHGRWLPRSA